MPPSRSADLLELLHRAGAEALSRRDSVRAERKPDGSPVTDADRAAEALLVEGLGRLFPDDGIVGEEGARVEGRPGAGTWFLDPIDGTSSYLHHLPTWGPTVCRVADGVLDVGALVLPRVGESWFAEAGGGAWRDGRRLGRPPEPDPGDPSMLLFAPSRIHRVADTPWPGKLRVLGSSAAHLAHVAAGAGALALVPRWSLWDVGCGVLLIQEVGRVICDPAGAPVDVVANEGLPLLAGASTAVGVLTRDGWAAEAARRSRE